MHEKTIVLSISLLLQIAAALLAFRLYRTTPRSKGWLLIATALILMSFRRFISLSAQFGFHLPAGEQLSAEITALIISSIMIIGIWSCRPLLRSQRTAKKMKNENLELKAGMDHFQELFDNMRSGVAVFETFDNGETFIIKDLNKGAERIENISREDIIGRLLTDAFPQVEHFGLLEVIRRVYHSDTSEHLPASLYQDDRIMGWRDNFVYKMSTGEVATIYTDVSERIQLIETLQKSERLYRGLVEQGTGLVYRSLPDTTLTFINQAYCELFDKKRSELIGEQFINLSNPAYKNDIYRAFSKLNLNHPTERHIEKVGTNDHARWIEWYNHGIFDEEGVLREIQGLGFDITKRLKMEKDLRQTNIDLEKAIKHAKELAQEAESANQAKTIFLANMSHELRTPLNAVVGCTDLLKTTDLSDEQGEYVKTIQEGAQILIGTITEILDLAKIEAGKQTPEPVAFNLKKMAVNTLSLLSNVAKRNHTILLLDCPDDLAPSFKGDRQKLQQVLTNLLNNAIKFTQNGTITLTIKPNTNNPNHMHFSVVDTGIGMAPKELETVFRPFEQAETPQRKQGTGLGLPISSKLVEIMGGTLNAESAVNKGSRFYFEIPLPLANINETVPSPPPLITAPRQFTNDLRIILAEDNEVNQLVVRRILEKVNLNSDRASDGRQLLEKTNKKTYNVILMDVQMPVMDGLAATREIRKTNQSVYIIGLTAFAYEKDQQSCYDAGMNDFVAKPIRSQQLLDALQRADDYISNTSAGD